MSEPRPFSDADLTAALRWFQLSDYPTVGVDKVDLAIRAVAEGQRRRHPVREWLHTLKWDGVPRVDTWLITYCGAVPANELHAAFIRAIGSKWLISAIARIEKPGCKVDHCLVLEGPQGGGKSTVFAVLGGEWFTDALPGDLTSKDASDFVAGVWIVELSELNQVKRASVETLKSFITRTTERFRPAYGRHKSIFRRSCVFGGSTNQNAYLTDPTGGRRFWPVRIGNINLMALRADREQLWAEALFRYRQGEIWWLTEEQTIATAIEEQAARYEADPWEEAIAAKVAVMTGPITIPYLLKEVLNIDLGMQRRSESNRVAEILTSLGLSRGKLSKGVSQWVKINRK